VEGKQQSGGRGRRARSRREHGSGCCYLLALLSPPHTHSRDTGSRAKARGRAAATARWAEEEKGEGNAGRAGLGEEVMTATAERVMMCRERTGPCMALHHAYPGQGSTEAKQQHCKQCCHWLATDVHTPLLSHGSQTAGGCLCTRRGRFLFHAVVRLAHDGMAKARSCRRGGLPRNDGPGNLGVCLRQTRPLGRYTRVAFDNYSDLHSRRSLLTRRTLTTTTAPSSAATTAWGKRPLWLRWERREP